MADRYKRGDGRSYHPLYGTWSQMLDRCYNPSNARYDRYGERGITVCARWHIFAQFLQDVGLRPKGCTIERIDNEGEYGPDNFKWATRAEQNRNTSRNNIVTVRGTPMPITDAARLLGVSVSTLSYRTRTKRITSQEAVDYYARRTAKREEVLKRDD